MLEKVENSNSETDESQYSFRLFHFQEIKCCTGEGRPKIRSCARIVQYKGRVYSFGGFHPANELVDPNQLDDELWELNLTTGKWIKCKMKDDKPEQNFGHTAVLIRWDSG